MSSSNDLIFIFIVPLTDALLFLVHNHEKVSEKDELLKALWPKSFVEESNLSSRSSLLCLLLMKFFSCAKISIVAAAI